LTNEETQTTEETQATGGDGNFVTELGSQLKENLPQSLLLSQVLGPSPAAGQQRAYVPPTAAIRSETREIAHLRALQDIAKARFSYPTEKHRDLKTYVNHPARTMGIALPNGTVAYPDIVVVQHPENNGRIVAEVETNETVREAVAQFEWEVYAQLAPLYLFVPVGKAHEARDLCRKYRIPVVGIRTWRYLPGYPEIEINET
jgi:hypothetical protein